MRNVLFIVFIIISYSLSAQNKVQYKTWNPAQGVYALEGQVWKGEDSNFYNRLPAKASKMVRPAVWNLSTNTAGVSLRFASNASQIIVRYQVNKEHHLPHMPATGVSGVDLFAKEPGADGWLWATGRFVFADTIQYTFTNLDKNGKPAMRDYTLFLPLYNSVKWLEIVTPAESVLKPITPRKEKPVVVYGTSIAQGGCASRPGLGFTNIVQRELDVPVINLAFSGNGRLEQPILDLMTEIDAAVYVLDCLPNLAANGLAPKLVNAVTTLKAKRKNVPIMLVEHCGYANEAIDETRRETYMAINRVQKQVYDSLIKSGMKNLYYLTKEEIGLDINSTVDYVHPNDVGMMKYAEAYTRKLKQIGWK